LKTKIFKKTYVFDCGKTRVLIVEENESKAWSALETRINTLMMQQQVHLPPIDNFELVTFY